MAKVNLFPALESLLLKSIPNAVAKLRIKKKICCLRVYYYDTHAPCTYLHLKAVTEGFRESTLDNKGASAIFYLWSSTEEIGDGPSVSIGDREEKTPLSKLFEKVYTLLCDDEDKYMPRFRALVQRVCLKLNTNDWTKICALTEDFVIAPADGSQHFADDPEDLLESIPARRLKLLRSNGLLGPDKNWERRPGFTYASNEPTDLDKEIEARVAAMSPEERITYWIDQLDKMAAGADCDVERLGCNAHYPLEMLKPLGKRVVVPLLRLAVKWAGAPEWTSDNAEDAELTPMHDVILYLLWMVKDMKHGDPQIERLLCEFLVKSCQINEGRKHLWGTLPVHCADCLHALFDGYPESIMEGNNALGNRAEMLKIARQKLKAK